MQNTYYIMVPIGIDVKIRYYMLRGEGRRFQQLAVRIILAVGSLVS